TKLPEVVNYNGLTGYKRGETFNSIAGLFVDNESIFVFSKRPNQENNFIIDKYRKNDGLYTNSVVLNYNKQNANDLRFVYPLENDGFFLGFKSFYSKVALH